MSRCWLIRGFVLVVAPLLVAGRTDDAAPLILDLVVANINLQIADARYALGLFKDVRSQMDYTIAMHLLVQNQEIRCQNAKAADDRASSEHRASFFASDCKSTALDVDGLASFHSESGMYLYNPAAVYVTNMMLSKKLDQLEQIRSQLGLVQERLNVAK